MKRIDLAFVLLIGTLVLASAYRAFGGTVIASTATYNGADVTGLSGNPPVSLPSPGVYYFDMVAVGTPTAASTFSGLVVYLQQQGVAGGNWYTVYNSTFATCANACSAAIVPDMYLGGNVRAQWTITTGSATLTVNARSVTP